MVCSDCGCETRDYYTVKVPSKHHAAATSRVICAKDCYPRYVRDITVQPLRPRCSESGESPSRKYEVSHYRRPRLYQELRT